MKTASRILLRLDDGSLIGDASRFGKGSAGTILRIPVEQAFELGRAGSPELYRLEHVIASLQGANGSPPAAAAAASPSCHPPKRPRKDNTAIFTHPLTPHHPPPAASAAAAALVNCQAMLWAVQLHMRDAAHVLWRPVTDDDAPGYSRLIKQPMSLSVVQARLSAGSYASPDDFRADMSLIFSNCRTYNHPDCDVGRLGKATGDLFEGLWEASDWVSGAPQTVDNAASAAVRERTLSSLFGSAPTDQEPHARAAASDGGRATQADHRRRTALSEATTPTAAAAPTTAVPSRPAKVTGVPRGRDMLPPVHAAAACAGAGAADPANAAAAAAAAAAAVVCSHQRRWKIATLVGELPEADQEAVTAVMALVPRQCLEVMDDEEVELDFKSMDDVSMAKLDAFFQRRSGGGGGGGGGVRLDADTSEDEGAGGEDSD